MVDAKHDGGVQIVAAGVSEQHFLRPRRQMGLAIRPTAVGKKNWLFIGDAGAGETSATLYTIIESARRRGLDPEAYLTDLLTRLPALKRSDLINHTPAAWAKAQKKRAA